MNSRRCCSEQFESGQGRQEEAHEAHVQRATDLRARENIRTDQVPGGSGTGETRVRAGHDRITGEGENTDFNVINIFFIITCFFILKF